ncbi:MAG: type II secretion system minor pseudopilin GspI [Candidatus Contendobacter sp.]|nr:type II secretion system minor pseudopilin GspI [Candidatus Contendobacter sp.]
MKRTHGFTLLEVLVALAVLAIAMGAIIHAATQSINTTATLRDRTFAGWVARNQINALLLESKPWPEEGSRAGKAELANRVWHWEARFHTTDDPNLRRLELTVRASEGSAELGKLIAFKGKPPEPSTDATSQPSGTADKPTAIQEGQTPTPRQPHPAP